MPTTGRGRSGTSSSENGAAREPVGCRLICPRRLNLAASIAFMTVGCVVCAKYQPNLTAYGGATEFATGPLARPVLATPELHASRIAQPPYGRTERVLP